MLNADRVNRDDPDQLLRGFSICFRRIANLGRSPTPNAKYGLFWWTDECRSWLRARHVIADDMSGAAYVAPFSREVMFASCRTTAAWGTPGNLAWYRCLNGCEQTLCAQNIEIVVYRFQWILQLKA